MPHDALRVACVQLSVTDVKADNIAKAEQLVARAASAGADVVVLPEHWSMMGDDETLRANAEDVEEGAAASALRDWARRHATTIVGGSILERRDDGDKLSNTCLVVDPDGTVVARYRKIHMFDVETGGHVYRESATRQPGRDIVVCEAEGWKLGLSVCYDIRFPELYRILALGGADLITVPAMFTMNTGRDHWEVLLRARAIENQCFVAAAATWGLDVRGRPSYGRSMIVDPWGVVMAQAPDADTVVVATLERDQMESLRRSLPALANRRPDAYTWPVAVG